MPIITLVNTDHSPCPGTHRAACLEFIQGFKEYGFDTSETTNLDNFHENDIVLMSSHQINISYLNILNEINPNAVYILWFYHSVVDKIPFKKFILTGEDYYYPPTLKEHSDAHLINISHIYCSMMLRANENPVKVGQYIRNPHILASFIGTPYRREWVDNNVHIYYHDINQKGLLTSEQRRDVYLQSIICLGFHHPNNVANSHVTQRVFEGLCYGCVVISDNKAARDMTNGIVEFVETKEELEEKINYLINNPDEIVKKQIAGYEWAKKYGTNRYSAKRFLNTIKDHWDTQYNDT